MTVQVAEGAFEEAIECGLRRNAPDACVRDAAALLETPGEELLLTSEV